MVETADVDAVGRLAHRIASVPDIGIRRGVVQDFVSRASATLVALTVQTAINEPGRVPNVDDLLMHFMLSLADDRGRREQVAQEAMQLGLSDVVLFIAPRDEPKNLHPTAKVPDFGTGRPLTLGERKSVARKRDRELIARVLRDPDPSVIAILLDNPALTETDVIRLAALRPVNPEVLRNVLRSLRWAVRYPVRTTLMQNPFLALDLAIPLAALLRRSDARKFAQAPDLRPELRAACARVSEARGAPN